MYIKLSKKHGYKWIIILILIVSIYNTHVISIQLSSNDFNMKMNIEDKTTINKKEICSVSQMPYKDWSKTYGGSELDHGYSVQETSDGGFFIVGSSFSYGESDICEAYLIKTDSSGNSQWQKHYGYALSDVRFEGWQTSSDGGFIVGGSYQPSSLVSKIYLLKTNSNGGKSWEKTYMINPLKRQDKGFSVKQTSDGGYIVTGSASYTIGTKETAFLLKTDSSGNEDWTAKPGDENGVIFTSSDVKQTSDGGYIIVGFKSVINYKNIDTNAWLCKTNSNGIEQWSTTFGGSGFEMGYSVQETSDGGYIFVGMTDSYGPNWDVYLVKISSSGGSSWQKHFDGSGGEDYGTCVQETSDGGYILVGFTRIGNDIDDWVIKTDSGGNIEWDSSFFASSSPDWAESIWCTSDGGYIITGYTESSGNGDVWLLKLKYNQPPNQPNNPDPSNGETDVDIDADLSWTGGDPDGDVVTYDIYFDTVSPPTTKVEDNWPLTTYDPGTMNPNTKYYWQIVAWDNHGASTSGPIWDFTTLNNPPNTPSNPDPYDGESGVDIDADLSWDGGDPDLGDTVTYDVYFGTTSPPPKQVSNQSDTSYNPGTMDYDETYHWKIVAWDDKDASSEGPEWDFTTTGGCSYPDWDIDCDGDCDLMDVNLVCLHYGEEGSPGWIREDIDDDGDVDLMDVNLVCLHYGEEYGPPSD